MFIEEPPFSVPCYAPNCVTTADCKIGPYPFCWGCAIPLDDHLKRTMQKFLTTNASSPLLKTNSGT